MLSSLIDSPVLLIDSFTISHILPRNRHQPNQTSQVLFASKCTVLNLTILTSAKNPCPSSMDLLKYLLGSNKLYTNWPIFNNLPATYINPHYTMEKFF